MQKMVKTKFIIRKININFMKIIEHIENSKGKTKFTFEILPPLKGQNIKSVFDSIDP